MTNPTLRTQQWTGSECNCGEIDSTTDTVSTTMTNTDSLTFVPHDVNDLPQTNNQNNNTTTHDSNHPNTFAKNLLNKVKSTMMDHKSAASRGLVGWRRPSPSKVPGRSKMPQVPEENILKCSSHKCTEQAISSHSSLDRTIASKDDEPECELLVGWGERSESSIQSWGAGSESSADDAALSGFYNSWVN
jgi:hypothetical protein